MSILLQLPSYLTWRSHPHLIAEIQAKAAVCRKKRFLSWLDAVDVHKELTRTFIALPPPSQERIYMSPAVSGLLKSVSARTTARFRQMIRAEMLRLGWEVDRPNRRSWTSTGDMVFPEGTKTCLLDGKICVDASSPGSRMSFVGCRGSESRHSTEELEIIVQRLLGATRSIRNVAPQAADCLFLIIKTIAVRRDMDQPNGFGSSSWPAEPGKIGLTNAHLANIPTGRIINALVHETVHSLLYSTEASVRIYDDAEAAFSISLKSPWTGRSLPLHSFTHACFVWYALWNYWRLYLKGREYEPNEHKVLLNSAASGFLDGSPLKSLRATRAISNSELLDSVLEMQTIVCEAVLQTSHEEE